MKASPGVDVAGFSITVSLAYAEPEDVVDRPGRQELVLREPGAVVDEADVAVVDGHEPVARVEVVAPVDVSKTGRRVRLEELAGERPCQQIVVDAEEHVALGLPGSQQGPVERLARVAGLQDAQLEPRLRSRKRPSPVWRSRTSRGSPARLSPRGTSLPRQTQPPRARRQRRRQRRRFSLLSPLDSTRSEHCQHSAGYGDTCFAVGEHVRDAAARAGLERLAVAADTRALR